VHERVDPLAIAHEHGLRGLLLHAGAKESRAARGEVGFHPVGEELRENEVRIDRAVVADLLAQLSGLLGELPHALAELAHTLRQLGRLLLDLDALETLGLDLLLGLDEVLRNELFLLLGDAHGDVEVLDALAGLGLLALHAGQFSRLALGLGALFLQLALHLGELLLGHERLLRGGTVALFELAGAGLGRRERALQLALLLLQRGDVFLALRKRALGGRKLRGQLFTRGFLILE
jgi:hypothetical protein